MAKPTLLELTQSILSDMDADEVNDISDTIEATQVASVIREVYRSILEEYDLQSTEVVFQLDASGTSAKPTHMTIPSNVYDVVTVRYDKRVAASDPPAFVVVPYTTPAEFLDLVSNRDASASNYQSATDDSGVVFIIQNDTGPSCWTTFDGGTTLVFDAFDSDVDSTLQSSKTQCLGRKRNDISLDSSSELNLPETLHQLVLNESRELCFDIFKDGAPRKVVELSRRSKAKAKERKNKVATPATTTLPDYGR